MDYNTLKALHQKYLEGLTNLEEEQALGKALEQYKGTDEELIEAAKMAKWMQVQGAQTSNLKFDDLMSKANGAKKYRLSLWLAAVAASLILGFLLFNNLPSKPEPIIYAYVDGVPITDRQEAMHYAQMAFGEVQNKLKKGTQGLNSLSNLNKPVSLLTNKTN